MKEQILTIKENRKIAYGTYEMVLAGSDTVMKSGQFVELKLDGFFLRRPFSVADCGPNMLTVVYKTVGQGTKEMSRLTAGTELSALTHLGNGFSEKAEKPLLIGGGVGCAPLYMLAKDFSAKGVKPAVVMGFKNADEIFYAEQFKKIADVYIATDDGSCGGKGNCVSLLKSLKIDFDRYFACGPWIMLKNLSEFGKNGELSLEARMGCGFGACMGCSVETTQGVKRVCKEGPVFDASAVIFGEGRL